MSVEELDASSETTEQASLAPVAAKRSSGSSRVRIVAVLAVIVLAVGFLLYKGLLSSLNYFDTVDDALAHRASIGTTTIRLEGVVVPKSVSVSGLSTDFKVAGQDGRTVIVHNTGSLPSLFQPDIPVVVVGHFTSSTSDVFSSDQILVKHSAAYIAKNPTRVTAPNGSVR